jgi:hypothetical protein
LGRVSPVQAQADQEDLDFGVRKIAAPCLIKISVDRYFNDTAGGAVERAGADPGTLWQRPSRRGVAGHAVPAVHPPTAHSPMIVEPVA